MDQKADSVAIDQFCADFGERVKLSDANFPKSPTEPGSGLNYPPVILQKE